MNVLIFSIALLMGVLCILAALFQYVKNKNFGVAGAVLVVFGTVLICFSVWKDFSVQIGADGGLTLNAVQEIGSATAEFNSKILLLEKKISSVAMVVDLLSKNSPGTSSRASEAIESVQPSKEFIKNQGYSVLVFHRKSQENNAESLTTGLLDVGFKASKTETSLEEVTTQFPGGTAWIVWTIEAKSKINSVKKMVLRTIPQAKIEVRADAYNLRRGDIQVMLF